MAHYSILSLDAIIEITKQYRLQKILSHVVLSGGSENTNYLITTERGKFVLTICEQKSLKSAQELADLLEYLAEKKFKTSKLVRTITDESISFWKDKPVMLKMFLEGKIVEDLSADLLKTIGREMGKLHQMDIPSYLPNTINYDITNFHSVKMYASGSSFEIWLNKIEAYIQPFLSKNLPKALIHSDIFNSNIVVSNDMQEACIMDFEEAADYYRIFDVGMTIVGLCSEGVTVNLKKVKYLLKGYQQQIELLASEKEALQAFTVYAAASMTFWRHRNFNYTNPDSKMYDHYLGLKVIADFVKNLPETTFLEILKD